MFGGFGAAGMAMRYAKEKEAIKTLPRREVSMTEFVKLLMNSDGLTMAKAKMQARINKNMGPGVWTHVGDEMLTIKRPKAKK